MAILTKESLVRVIIKRDKKPGRITIKKALIEKGKVSPWTGGLVEWSIIPYTKGCGFDPQLGCVQEVANQCFSLIDVSLPLRSVGTSSSED